MARIENSLQIAVALGMVLGPLALMLQMLRLLPNWAVIALGGLALFSAAALALLVTARGLAAARKPRHP